MYQFYENATGKWMNKHVSVGDENRRDILSVSGSYALCRNFADVETIVNEQVPTPENVDVAGKTAIVLTIEGMHAFGAGHIKEGKDVSFEVLKQRTIEWKTQLEFPIFFITFSHHFSNTLCGHAHSLPRITRLIVDQKPMMGEGFTENGIEMAELLMNIGRFAGAQAIGNRILIDVKHMSPLGRAMLYKMVQQHNRDFPSDKVPIIASHVGFSGLQNLSSISGQGKSLFRDERDGASIDGFESKGLIGLSMDQRVMASKKTNRMVKGFLRGKEKQYKLRINILLNHILGIIRAIDQSDLLPEDRGWVWKSLTLGSDFDGFIDPIDNYPACTYYTKLQQDLLGAIRSYNVKSPMGLLSAWTGNEEELVNMICFDNAYQFLQKHF